MALGSVRTFGRSGVLKGRAREQMLHFIRWCAEKMGDARRPDFDRPDFDYRIYVGHLYDGVGGKTHMKQVRNIRRRNLRGSPFVIALHFDRRTLCSPFDMAHIIVHELRHALDYQWAMRLFDPNEQHPDKVHLRNGLFRNTMGDMRAMERSAERRAEQATRAFFRDVREFEIIRAYERIFSPEVREQLCDSRTRFMAAMQRMGR